MFRYSICDPLKATPIQMGPIDKDQILDIFDQFPWSHQLERMNSAEDDQVYFSPSLEFEHQSSQQSISISVVENDQGHEFYIFYKRPKTVVRLFGSIRHHDPDFVSERTGQSRQDARDALVALIEGDFTTLEKRWG